MIRLIKRENLGKGDYGWLNAEYHFSFARYNNPNNMSYGVLNVLNNDIVKPGHGFDMHGHKDMEVVSYVVRGELTHADSLGNEHVLKRGDIQYMSSGTGIIHSEHNYGSEDLQFLQIWIPPREKALSPFYSEKRIPFENRKDEFLHIVSDKGGKGIAEINQDVNFYAIDAEENVNFDLAENRQAYIILIEGNATINDIELKAGDAVECDDKIINITPSKKAHILIIEMSK